MLRHLERLAASSRWVWGALAAAICCAPAALAAEQATGVGLYEHVNSSTYRYNIDLKDSGTTNIGTLWYSWVPGSDFLPVAPTNITSPAGWTAQVTHASAADGYAIQWVTSTAPLTAGQTLDGFGFDIQQTPTQLAAGSNPTTFIYGGAPFSDAGFEFSIVPTTTPWQNPFSHVDVNNNGTLSPLDALQVINELLTNGPHALATPTPTNGPAPFLDVTGDNAISNLDALQVINAILGAENTTVSPQMEPMAMPMFSTGSMAVVSEPASGTITGVAALFLGLAAFGRRHFAKSRAS